jgi:hypothetical protein
MAELSERIDQLQAELAELARLGASDAYVRKVEARVAALEHLAGRLDQLERQAAQREAEG